MKPSDFNLPSKFTDFQPGQFEAIKEIAQSISSNRFTLFSGPTGSGKTLMMIAAAILNSGRVLICTVKKDLQDQYIEDFASIGVVEVRGQANYRCLALDPGGELSHLRPLGATGYMGCDQGPCRVQVPCQLKFGGCGKYDAIRAANDARIVVTNYAYRISMARHKPDVLGKFDLLILDEAHAAANWVEQFNTAVFKKSVLSELVGAELPTVPELPKNRGLSKGEKRLLQDIWVSWATEIHPEVQQKVKFLKSHDEKDHKLIVKLKDLDNSLSVVRNSSVDWSIESGPTRDVKFKGTVLTPTWVGPLCEKNLFCGVEKVILTSATLSEDVAKYTGIKRGEYNYLEMPSKFSARRRPVLYTKFKGNDLSDPNRKVCVKFPFRLNDEILQTSRLDQIIEARQDRKGLVLPVSYDRMQIMLQYSKWASSGVLFGHKKGSTNVHNALERFRQSDAPSCFISPPSGEGVDLKGDQCRYIYIPKVPMVPTQSVVMKERCRQDDQYINYLTGLNVVQYVGRGMRGPDDWCEVLIGDGQWEWFVNKANFAKWFNRACFAVDGLPAAMEEPKNLKPKGGI